VAVIRGVRVSAEARAGERVLGGEFGWRGAQEFEHGAAGFLRREWLAEALEVLGLRLGAASGIGSDGGAAEVRERGEAGPERRERDLETGAVGLVLGVGRENLSVAPAPA
jgi:hypothetical protein